MMRVSSGVFLRVQPDPMLFHVRPYKTGWCVAVDGAPRPLSMHATKQDAIALANSLARRGARVQMHDLEGSTSEPGAVGRAG